MKKWIKTLSLVLTSIVFLSFVGCKKSSEESTGGEVSSETEKLEVAIDVNTNDTLYLYNAGNSNYKIVIPQQSSQYEIYAAQELQTFFDEATGYQLPIITDEGIEFREDSYYISLGATTLRADSGVVCDSSLGTDGYKLVTKGNTFILSGYDGYGTLYSAYEFLSLHVGYEAYAVDEIFVEAKRTVEGFKLDITDIPDIAVRMSGYTSTRTSAEARVAGRMRLLASTGGGEPIFGEGKFHGWVHSMLNWILPWNDYAEKYDASKASEYDEKYGNWSIQKDSNNVEYVVKASSNGQPWMYPVQPTIASAEGYLCFTNDEMKGEFIDSLIKTIDANPDTEYFHVSVMDAILSCTCDRCLETDAVNGGPGGTMMLFINDVASAVKAHLAAEGGQRDVTIVTLAYHNYETAPVVKNGEGKYVAVNENVKAADNVMVMVAPIFACRAHGIDDLSCDVNVACNSILHGWAAVCDRIAIYDYDTHYDDSFLYLNNYYSMKYNFELYKDLGVEFVFPLGDIYNARSNFSELNTYLHSKLLWDTSLNMETLVEDFMYGYYKDAGDEMFDYYKAILSHYDWISRSVDGHKAIEHWFVNFQRGDVNINKATYWPEHKLLNLQSYLTKAYEKVEKSYRSDEEKETLKLRILTEEVSIRYYYLTMYGKSNYTNDQYEILYNELVEDCKKVGYNYKNQNTRL